MNRNIILKADILDIIFEKRNKAYGAYDLRKFYPGRLKLSLGLMLIIAIAFSAFTLIPQKRDTVIAKNYTIPDAKLKEVQAEKEKPREVPKKQPELAKPETTETPVPQKILTNHVEIVANTVKTDSIVTLLPIDKTGTTAIFNPNPATVLVTPVNTQPGNVGTTGNTTNTDITIPREGDAVDVLPSFPGGMDALKKFLEKNLHTPDELENGQTVSVRVKFVVGYNGKLQSFVTVLDGGDAYNKEVVRVLKKMPDWIPGKAKGEDVPVYYTIPVKFVMTD